MNKQFIIYGVTILLLLLELSGCFDDNNIDKKNGENLELNEFIGRWKTSIYYYDINGTKYDEQPSNSTFYTNGTMGSESVENNETIWTPYTVENNKICFGEVTDEDYICYDYAFSEDGTLASLEVVWQDPYYGDVYHIFIDMIKY